MIGANELIILIIPIILIYVIFQFWRKQGRSSVKASQKSENETKHDSNYMDSETEAKTMVAGLNYKLSDLNVICLNSCKQSPSQRMYNYEFNFEGNPIKSVVIHSCWSGSDKLKLHAWLFDTEKPDLFQEKPIGTLYLNSAGRVEVHKGAPFNYMAILEDLEKDGLL